MRIMGSKAPKNTFKKKIVTMEKYTIKRLRHLVVNEQDFDVIQTYFFDWIESHETIAFEPIPAENPQLAEMLRINMATVYMKAVNLDKLLIREVKSINFIHGSAFIEGDMLIFFYFTDLDWGIIMCTDDDGEGYTLRFKIQNEGNPTYDLSTQQN
jgi:hypothetical protein